MRSALLLSASLLLISALQAGEPERAKKMPAWLELVPEMMPLEGLRLRSVPRGDTIANQVQEARTALQKKRPEIERQITPEVVRSLSRWAQSQMKEYEKVPSLAKAVWKPVGDDKQGRLVLEGTVDTLPTHHRLVTRWLKVYVVYDGKAREVVRVIVTIRGEVLE